MVDNLDPKIKRNIYDVAYFFILGLVIYTYLYDLMFYIILFTLAWLAYEYIQDLQCPRIDPAGRHVLVTGCDSGFGLASALDLAGRGFCVHAGCLADEGPGPDELRQAGARVHVLDVTSEESVSECAAAVGAVAGDAGLWGVVNNAGINVMGAAELVTMATYQRCVDVNLWGAVRLTKALLPLLRRARGRVVNVTSERAINPWPHSSPYCISKFGLEAFSDCLRGELAAFGVKVVTVAPGNFSAASAITSQAATKALLNNILAGRDELPETEQAAYPKEDIEALVARVEADRPRSCPSPEPVVAAYRDALTAVYPRRRVLVVGMKRQSLDPTVVCARLRPLLPPQAMDAVTWLVMLALNRDLPL